LSLTFVKCSMSLGFAGSTSSPEWFARLACRLLRKAMQILPYHSLPAFDRFIFPVLSIGVARLMRKYQSLSAQPLMGGRHKYSEVLSSALRGSLAALPSPPQCHVALGMMSCTFVWVDHCPF